MSENVLKDLFNEKRYEEVIELLEGLYCDLYKEMLEYKKVEVNEKTQDYVFMTSLVRKEYPQFLDNFIFMQSIASDPQNTYLDHINVLLSTYTFFKKEYKKTTKYDEFENAEFTDIE